VTIIEQVTQRGIDEVVHFTTWRGLTGILDTGAALSRSRVRVEERLEFILKLNSATLRDPEWEDYVNLSITEINSNFFNISCRWHPGIKWAIASFDSLILDHPGMYFTTTNNIYPSCRRQKGSVGLAAMFADPVLGRYGTVHTRAVGMPANLTTDVEAEVLYPQKLSTEFLRAIYVSTPDYADEVAGCIRLVGHANVQVVVAPERFAPSTRR
jgi:hypothetical protein